MYIFWHVQYTRIQKIANETHTYFLSIEIKINQNGIVDFLK